MVRKARENKIKRTFKSLTGASIKKRSGLSPHVSEYS
jgi:hypothetical protein